MLIDEPYFELKRAVSDEDVRSAQRLRYEVFIEEMGASGPLVDHDERLEKDRFDPFVDHLLLLDHRRDEGDQVVGVYRAMRSECAEAAGSFYSADEYDLTALKRSGLRLLELGRSCLHRDYRGGTAMMHLWNGLAAYIEDHKIDALFGVASFPGTDVEALAPSLSLLHYRHLAPEHLRPVAREPGYQRMDLLAEDSIDRIAAIRQMPALIKAYLRIGGCVGLGAFVDQEFNCVDVCLVLDIKSTSAKHLAIYKKPGRVQ